MVLSWRSQLDRFKPAPNLVSRSESGAVGQAIGPQTGAFLFALTTTATLESDLWPRAECSTIIHWGTRIGIVSIKSALCSRGITAMLCTPESRKALGLTSSVNYTQSIRNKLSKCHTSHLIAARGDAVLTKRVKNGSNSRKKTRNN